VGSEVLPVVFVIPIVTVFLHEGGQQGLQLGVVRGRAVF
jgi:hypothetical protein